MINNIDITNIINDFSITTGRLVEQIGLDSWEQVQDQISEYDIWSAIYKHASKDSGTVLDAGSGDGKRLHAYFGNSATALDINPNNIKKCQELGLNTIQADLHTPLNDRYDKIICVDVIEHVSNPAIVLKNLWNSCDKLIISTPNRINHIVNKYYKPGEAPRNKSHKREWIITELIQFVNDTINPRGIAYGIAPPNYITYELPHWTIYDTYHWSLSISPYVLTFTPTLVLEMWHE
jgi:hypothetical protein